MDYMERCNYWTPLKSLFALTLLFSGSLSANTNIGSPALDCDQLGWLSYNPQDFLWYIEQGEKSNVRLPASLYGHKISPPKTAPYSLTVEKSAYERALQSCYSEGNNVIYSENEMASADTLKNGFTNSAELIVKYIKQSRIGDINHYQKDFDKLNAHIDNLLNKYSQYAVGSDSYTYTELNKQLQSEYSSSKWFMELFNKIVSYKEHPNQEIRKRYANSRNTIKGKLTKIDNLALHFKEQAKLETQLSEYVKNNDLTSIENLARQEEIKKEINNLLSDIKSQKAKESIGKPALAHASKGGNQLIVLITMSIVTIFTCIGTIVGLARKAPVYYDFDDLMYSAGIFAWPVAISLFIFSVPIPAILANLILWGPTVFLTYKVIAATWNVGPRALLPIIVVTKVVWALMLVSAILIAMNPSGKTRQARRTKRTLALFFLAVATPIISRLIARKEGKIFNPNVLSISGVRGVDRVSSALRG